MNKYNHKYPSTHCNPIGNKLIRFMTVLKLFNTVSTSLLAVQACMANNDMFHVCYRNTRHVSVHWKELGVLLNVEKHCLDEIDRDNPRDVVSCRMDMLSAWLRSNPADPAAELDAALDDLQRTVHGEKK